jgi:sulfite dehydrogenase
LDIEHVNRSHRKRATGLHGAVRLRVLRWVAAAMLALAAIAQARGADDEHARALLVAYKCTICHADEMPKAGPAYADVAAAYRGDPRAARRIATVIRRGQHGGGPWHMPPHPEVSKSDALLMARYILSLDRATPAAAHRDGDSADEPRGKP